MYIIKIGGMLFLPVHPSTTSTWPLFIINVGFHISFKHFDQTYNFLFFKI